ncbi:hypothetical protein HOK10_04060 [candidate division WWE3 bacterium]|jgi:hypothetical protein|nr:hypothetical protein [candidate division WWE3 bacterium]
MYSRRTILLTFILLFIWWALIHLTSFHSVYSVEQFGFAVCIFSIFGYLLLIFAKGVGGKAPKGSGLVLLGFITDAFFSYLGYSFDIANLQFLVLSNFLVVWGISVVLNPDRSRDVSLQGAFLLVLFVVLLSSLFSGTPVTTSGFDSYRFILFYTPLYRTSIVVLSLLFLLKEGLRNAGIWKSSFSVGYSFLLLGDLVFYRGFLVGSLLSQGSHYFLGLCGVLFLLLGVSWMRENPLSVFDIHGPSITYFKTRSHKVPISLN